MLDVVYVELDAALVGGGLAARHLPETRHSRLDRQQGVDVLAVAGQLGLGHHPRPDERHLAPEHIEELGQLVDAVAANHPTDRSDTGIVGQLVVRLELGKQLGVGLEDTVCIYAHRAELEGIEWASAPSHHPPPVQNRPRGAELDGQDRGDEQRRQQQADRGRSEHIDGTLHKTKPAAGCGRGPDCKGVRCDEQAVSHVRGSPNTLTDSNRCTTGCRPVRRVATLLLTEG